MLANTWENRPPTMMQLAADGEWEKAWSWPIAGPPSDSALQSWLDANAGDIAAEVFFDDGTSDDVTGLFIGVRIADLNRSERSSFLRCTIDKLRNGDWPSLRTVVDNWWSTISSEAKPSNSGPDTLEVGVVNAWHSVGARVVWERGDPGSDETTLRELLGSDSPLLRPQPLPIAVELAYRSPRPQWLALPVSERTTEGHRLRFPALAHIVRQVAAS